MNVVILEIQGALSYNPPKYLDGAIGLSFSRLHGELYHKVMKAWKDKHNTVLEVQ